MACCIAGELASTKDSPNLVGAANGHPARHVIVNIPVWGMSANAEHWVTGDQVDELLHGTPPYLTLI
jgi:hypothetical protein